MKNLKAILTTSVAALVLTFGAASAGAQTRRQVERQQQKVEKQQQKIDKQREKLERQRDRLAEQRQREREEQIRLENMRNNRNAYGNNNRYRVYRNGGYYQTDNRGAELLRQAVNRGYQEGYRAGQTDRSGRRRADYNGSSIYRSGNYGYQSYVDASQYQYYFREGFRRGYEDGYNSRSQYGSNYNGNLNILGTILQQVLNIQPY